MPAFNEVRLLLGADAYHSDSYFNDSANALRIKAYTRTNAYVGVAAADDRWSLMLAGKNITDEETVAGANVGSGGNIRYLMPPREWMLTLSVKR